MNQDQRTPNLLSGPDSWRLEGDWTLTTLAPRLPTLQRQLTAAGRGGCWDLSAVDGLDSGGGLLLLEAWGGELPAELKAEPRHRRLLEELVATPLSAARRRRLFSMHGSITTLGERVLGLADLVIDIVTLFGRLLLALMGAIVAPRRLPLRELSATLYRAGLQALPITGLVGLLIGIVLSYLSALQLRLFGSEAFIVNLVGLSTARELGPLLGAILVAGRSGSAMTAQLGMMRLTEELDALRVLGVSPFQRLIMPRVLGLGLLMPLIAFWTSVCGILGGMVIADLELGISYGQFATSLPGAIPSGTYWLSLCKAVVFGLAVGAIACCYGLRVQPNTASLGMQTTGSVVASITVVILLDAVFAVAFRQMGWHG